MEKLDLTTPNFTNENAVKLAELFPNCVTEKKNDKGEIIHAIDFDALRQEFSDTILEGQQERYSLNWPGKREALVTANTPISKTLRPCRDESVDFDNTKNMFIEGDNLDALKLLQETYLNKIKMIYIDPPYNTGNDFIYNDTYTVDKGEYEEASGQRDEDGNRLLDEEKFKQNNTANGRFHSDWLSMMYPRLKLARNLLKEDGVIFISIDDGEQANLRKVCDEIFGSENFVNNIIWQKKYSPSNDAKWLSDNHDFIVCYAKKKEIWRPNLLPRSEAANARYKNVDNDPRGDWKSSDLSVKSYSAHTDFPIETPSGRIANPPKGGCWRVSKDKFNEMLADNRIWFGSDGSNVPSIKRFLSEVKDGITPLTIWTYKEVGHNQTAKTEVKKLFEDSDASIFDTPKPVALMQRLIEIGSNRSSIVLDFFAGSASFSHGVMAHNAETGGERKCISVQLPEKVKGKDETIADLSKERIRRAGKKIKEDNADKDGIENLDTGFRVFKIDSSNMVDVTLSPDEAHPDMFEEQVGNIKKDRSSEDLLFQVLLDWGVDLSLPINREDIDSKEVFFVDGNALAACFDNNINEDFVKKLADKQPLRVVFRDDGFTSDSVKINVEQIFKLKSPTTDIKVI